MRLIGIRELRQNASAYLRLVERGETLQIGDRGRPVALWVPIPSTGGIERLEAESRLTDAKGDVLDLGPPPRGKPGAPRPSTALARARKNER
jgi:antitoxin (DNA-binding transcriptional repressor) of toxin-antitoxin stability system